MLFKKKLYFVKGNTLLRRAVCKKLSPVIVAQFSFFSHSPLTRLVFPPSLSRCLLFNWISRIRWGDIQETIKKTRKVRSGGSRGLVKLRITSLIIIVRGSNAPLFFPYSPLTAHPLKRREIKKEEERGKRSPPSRIITCAAFSFSTKSSSYEESVLFIALNRRIQRNIPPSLAARQCGIL